MAMIRVLLADDQALFREGLRRLLGAFDDLEVVGEAADGEQAVRAAARLRPDVVLMDLRMPVLDGAAATRRLVDSGATCRVLALTTFDDRESVFEALRAGAVGYLLKDVDSEALVDAIRTAARGGSVLEPMVARTVVDELRRLSLGAGDHPALPVPLTERELEVLRHVARGLSNKEIAARLAIAEGTVKNRMTSVLDKLGVDDRTQAALRARELGLV